MSRSVKKHPVWNDQCSPGSVWAKRQASKAVRRYTCETSNGKWYRKVYCPWNIRDYSFYKTKQQAIREWETSDWERHRNPTLTKAVMDWYKMYKRK
ncbi:hypothetical protein AMQ84_26645 [Paenibacillus riograndensis]|uniref:Uncharacterized protein n=1 Tax=Paenibacillus riograndensis TaxID=483937 RepID=A0A132TLL7_9BACL|nr:hypothetical protein [Paenibacillus riograndensis]KWX72258.1 hypothetical protein AMQ84_26645 [Paenibacillus riograndensis]KWX85077.1 hypothetical protein AMQ83_26975 [Paenibacillus riograndensis]